MTIATSTDTKTLLLDVSNTTLNVTPEQFDRLCIDNPDLRLELTPERQLIVMTPAFGESGKQNGPVVPDFVIELRSATDRLGDVRKKMVEYQRLGVKLGLLINPQDKQVEVYELGLGVKTCQSPTSIDCDSVMPGFDLSLTEIW